MDRSYFQAAAPTPISSALCALRFNCQINQVMYEVNWEYAKQIVVSRTNFENRRVGW